jgi:hypothetical protein
MMRRATGFHADQAGRNLAEELEHLFAAQLSVDDDLAIAINAMDLEDILGEINADATNLHVDDPLDDAFLNDHPLADAMPEEAGVVHPHETRRSAFR